MATGLPEKGLGRVTTMLIREKPDERARFGIAACLQQGLEIHRPRLRIVDPAPGCYEMDDCREELRPSSGHDAIVRRANLT